jgi:hypothetical protein
MFSGTSAAGIFSMSEEKALEWAGSSPLAGGSDVKAVNLNPAVASFGARYIGDLMERPIISLLKA